MVIVLLQKIEGRGRAQRRFDDSKKLNLARRVVLRWRQEFDPVFVARSARIYRDNLAYCSRPCCGNPRHHLSGSGFTERRQGGDLAALVEEDWLDRQDSNLQPPG